MPNNLHSQKAWQIVQDILRYDDPQNTQRSLRKMIDAYFLYHEIVAKEEKEEVYFCFQLLDDALENLKSINQKQKAA